MLIHHVSLLVALLEGLLWVLILILSVLHEVIIWSQIIAILCMLLLLTAILLEQVDGIGLVWVVFRYVDLYWSVAIVQFVSIDSIQNECSPVVGMWLGIALELPLSLLCLR